VVACATGVIWKSKSRAHRVFLFSLFVVVHGVFAMAQTKMVSYTMVLFPLYVVAIGHALTWLVDHAIEERYRPIVLTLTTIVIAGHSLGIDRLQLRHTLTEHHRPDERWREQQMQAIAPLAALKAKAIEHPRAAVFNIPALHHIQFMFGSDAEAWDRLPDAATVERLAAKGYTIYAVQDGLPLDTFPGGVIVITDEEIRFPNVGRPE
jgi:4-amino-4-deoxy-L-arabinose transferase-like glycosyltransferase